MVFLSHLPSGSPSSPEFPHFLGFCARHLPLDIPQSLKFNMTETRFHSFTHSAKK